MNLLEKGLSVITKGDSRNDLIKKNILLSFFLKGISISISLLYVPMMLNYLNPTRYGIWMTLTSIVAWFGLFDIGLGNGLRNKLTEAISQNDKELAKKYVSTAYFTLTFIVTILFICFWVCSFFIDWTKILNTSNNLKGELTILSIFVFFSFCLKFVLQIITTVMTADQKPAIGNLFDVIGNLLGLVLVWILINSKYTSLLAFAISVLYTPIIVLFFASLLLYRTKYSFLSPSFNKFEFIYVKDLASLGVQFFIVQVATVVIFQTSNILISQFFSPADVTPYNITFKYFSIITMVWSIVMTPLWSAFTNAMVQKDYNWMRKTIEKLNKYMIVTFFIIVIMAILAKFIIKFWTSNIIDVSLTMITIFALYTLISIWNNIYAYFLNGTTQIKIQIITSVFAATLHIPLSVVMVNYFKLGPEGIVLSMTIVLSLFAIAGPLKTFNILKNERTS